MKALLQRFLKHLFYIFKVYLCLALIGALAGIGVQLLWFNPILYSPHAQFWDCY